MNFRRTGARGRALAMTPLAFAIVVAAALGGCASRCKQALVKCRYECERSYQLCQIQNIDNWYCRNQAGNCNAKCDDENAGCSWWHW